MGLKLKGGERMEGVEGGEGLGEGKGAGGREVKGRVVVTQD